jgi:hypothetical protein
MVSIEMAKTLKFPRIEHDTPYKVSWLNEGQYFLVNEQNWVALNIGGYKDIVICDILPMDVCHFFLGRPLKFDRNAWYDGRRNNYEINKDGISFTLTPLQEDDKGKIQETNVMMFGRKEFIKLDGKEDRDFATTPRLGDVKTIDMKNLIF